MVDKKNDPVQEEFDNILTLKDEKGNEIPFEFLDLIDYNDHEYVVLLSTDENEDEVLILEVVEDENEDEEAYIGIEDEDVLNAVFEIFKERNKDDFDFTD
jgi:uncharacterized protein YrzB (UPF0473 family)